MRSSLFSPSSPFLFLGRFIKGKPLDHALGVNRIGEMLLPHAVKQRIIPGALRRVIDRYQGQLPLICAWSCCDALLGDRMKGELVSWWDQARWGPSRSSHARAP